MIESGVTVGLGTDGAASNNTLDLLRDMQLAALLHKGVSGDPTLLPARTLIEMITTTGARVLGLGDRVGRLSEGMEADVVCLATDSPNGFPIYEEMSHLAYAARAADVLHVLVAGRPVVRDRQLLTLDVERLRSRTVEVASRIRGR
jgi:5-methylthioadenosine/S-adenosylhomocysteine deaminase